MIMEFDFCQVNSNLMSISLIQAAYIYIHTQISAAHKYIYIYMQSSMPSLRIILIGRSNLDEKNRCCKSTDEAVVVVVTEFHYRNERS